MRAAEIDIRAANLIRLPLSDSPGTKRDVHHNRLWSMPNQPQLTARGASLMGVVFIAFSLIPILGRLRAIRVQPTDGTPGWVAICAGLGFLFAGAILLSDAVAGGTGPDGQLLDDVPPWIKRFRAVMGLAIAVNLATIASWVAFGSGERHFSMSVSVPFMAARGASSESLGRWMFGSMAVLIWIVIAGALISTAREALAKRGDARDG